MSLQNLSKYCDVADCALHRVVKAFCHKHYARFKQHGDANISLYNLGVGDTEEQRFWSRAGLTADIDRCWNWQASLRSNGYGQVTIQGKYAYAHRAAWFYTHGIWPTMLLLHSCDNRKCVNPNHLREGTQQDNINDAKDRGRLAQGEANGSSKLTTTNVMVIREQFANGKSTPKELGSRFAVTSQSIRNIINRKTWKHVD